MSDNVYELNVVSRCYHDCVSVRLCQMVCVGE